MRLILILICVMYTNALNTLIIFLGCAIPEILEDRISTTISYANIIQNDNVTMFLSGGVKYQNSFDVSEASKTFILLTDKSHYANIWEYELDVESINTAENLIRAKQYVLKNKKFDTIYISTSRFHYQRAKLFAEHIFQSDFNISWILAPYETLDLIYWETVHIRNVYKDVDTALSKIKEFNP